MGCEKDSYTFHRGQVPPELEKCTPVADWRLDMLPARSTRTKVKGMPRLLGRCSVERREAIVS